MQEYAELVRPRAHPMVELGHARVVGKSSRHPRGLKVAKLSLNPCLVVGARSAALDGEPAVQESKRRILLRFTAADIGQSGEVDKGARAIVSRP